MNQPIKNNNNNMIPKQAIDPIGMPEEKGRHGTWADEKPSNCTCGIMKMQIRLQCGCDSTEAISSYGTKCSHTLLSKSASPDIVQAVAGPMCAPPPQFRLKLHSQGNAIKSCGSSTLCKGSMCKPSCPSACLLFGCRIQHLFPPEDAVSRTPCGSKDGTARHWTSQHFCLGLSGLQNRGKFILLFVNDPVLDILL